MSHKHLKTMFTGFLMSLILMLTKCTGTVFSNCVPDYTSIYWQDITFSPVSEDKKIRMKCTFNVPEKSQGDWLNGKACLPTTVSMVLDYFHYGNPALPTATISQFVANLDPGDITPGNGIYVKDIIDELQDLGYQNSFYMMTPTMTINRLKIYLIDGPVIVQLGVELGHNPRRILGVGDHQHAAVLLGFSLDGQAAFVNDPWSGSQVELPVEVFLDMWTYGYNVALMIRT